MGMEDIPAMIDYVLAHNPDYEKLHYVGHSQGTTAFFVMASERPEYNDKIYVMNALAPVAFMGNMEGVVGRALGTMIASTEVKLKLNYGIPIKLSLNPFHSLPVGFPLVGTI